MLSLVTCLTHGFFAKRHSLDKVDKTQHVSVDDVSVAMLEPCGRQDEILDVSRTKIESNRNVENWNVVDD